MGNWGSFELEDLIAEFPVRLKQAMYAAANKGTIRRGTWDHCALNAADKMMKLGVENFSRGQTPDFVHSTKMASQAFGITNAQASHFIRIWDSRGGTDEQCTEYLKECILKAGLFTEPGSKLPRIVTKRVYTSEETKVQEEFFRMMEANEVPDIDVAIDLLFTSAPPEEELVTQT